MSLDNISKEEWALAKLKLQGCDSGTKLKRSWWRPYTNEKTGQKVRLTHSFMNIDGQIYAFATGKPLGQGGFGKVKLVKNEENAVFAIKISHQKNKDEASVLIDYNIQKAPIATRKNQKKPDKHYYLMDYLGDDLGKYLHKKSPDKELRANISLQCASQLRDLHTGKSSLSKTQRGHYDVKEGNFVIKGGVVRLIDFGFARPFTDTRKFRCGTLNYMAPEVQQKGMLSPAADVYSLGRVLANINPKDKQIQKLARCMMQGDRGKRPELDRVEIFLLVKAYTSDEDLSRVLQERGYDHTVKEAKAIAVSTYCGSKDYDKTNHLMTETLAAAWDYIRQHNRALAHGKDATPLCQRQ